MKIPLLSFGASAKKKDMITGYPMPSKEAKQALLKIADLLSLRSHSRKELKAKLFGKFPIETIEMALAQAEKNRWLEAPSELARKTADKLHSKNKSGAYIKVYLAKKGLPAPPLDPKTEKAKAQRLLLKKTAGREKPTTKEKLKLKAFLLRRGFALSLINELLK